MLHNFISEQPVKRGFEAIATLYQAVGADGYIAGSYAAFMIADAHIVQPNDVDIFATSEQGARRIAKSLNELGYTMVDVNDVVFSLEATHITPYKLPVQIVKPNPKWATFPDDIINDFDMDICRALLMSPRVVWADANVGQPSGKFLRVNNPLRSLKRMMKYHLRGVQFDEWELLKLFRAWEEMPQDRKDDLMTLYCPGNQSMPDEPSGDYRYEEDDWFEGE